MKERAILETAVKEALQEGDLGREPGGTREQSTEDTAEVLRQEPSCLIGKQARWPWR